MNTKEISKIWILGSAIVMLSAISAAAQLGKPKTLLVVTATAGFRHDIETVERSLDEIAQKSGVFKLDFLRQPPGRPTAPKRPPSLKEGASVEEKNAYETAAAKFGKDDAVFQTADARWRNTKLKKALVKLRPALLARYDGIIFASTTGELPIPDRPGFLDWIRSGRAFIGIHAASDTFHHWPEFIEMLGGEFKSHGAQVGVELLNVDPANPATRHLKPGFELAVEEIYLFKSYDPARVHELIVLDKHPNDYTPGRYPIAWTRDYGKGRVFYTALGHRRDLWDTDPLLKDRKNPVAAAVAFRAHILGGMIWAMRVDENKQSR